MCLRHAIIHIIDFINNKLEDASLCLQSEHRMSDCMMHLASSNAKCLSLTNLLQPC